GRHIEAVLAQQLSVDRFCHPQLTHGIETLRQQPGELARHVPDDHDRRAQVFGQVRNDFRQRARAACGGRDCHHPRRRVGRFPRRRFRMRWLRRRRRRANPFHVHGPRRVERRHQLLAHRREIDAHRTRWLAHELERAALERAQRHLVHQLGTSRALHYYWTRHLRHDLLEGLEPVQTWHLDVESNDIWFELADFLQRLDSVPRRTDHAKCSARFHQLGDQPAHEGAVVDDEDGRAFFGRVSHRQPYAFWKTRSRALTGVKRLRALPSSDSTFPSTRNPPGASRR